MELLKDLSIPTVWIIALAVLAYFGRNMFEGALKSHFAMSEKLIEESLSIKSGLRTHEQDELVAFRVAVEKWEFFLQTAIGDLVMNPDAKTFEPADYQTRELKLYGAVRLTAVRASIYLRDPDLETELLRTVSSIRNLYHPLLAAAIKEVIEIQGEMLPYLDRMRLFEASKGTDTSVALTPDEADVLIELRHKASGVLRRFAEDLITNYRPIAEQLYDVKTKINVHIYRPLKSHAIEKV